MSAEHMRLGFRGDHRVDDEFEDLRVVLHQHREPLQHIAQPNRRGEALIDRIMSPASLSVIGATR